MATRNSSSRDFEKRWGGCGGGVNLKSAPNLLKPNQLLGALNATLDEQGGAAKRLGSDNKGTIGSGGDRVISMYTFYRGSTTPQMLAQTSGGKLYYTTDPTAGTITWTQITTGLSATAPFSFETFTSKVYMSNGVDAYASWDGSTYTTFASAPKGKYLRLWKDAMWASGIAGFDDRVYASQAGDAETWPVANWVDIAKGDGDVQMALHTDGFTLIGWKRLKTFSIYDPVTFANRLVDFEKGCESHFSVIYNEGQIFFLSRRGICRYIGDSPSEIVSGNLDPIFDPLVLNISALSSSWAYSCQNRVGWAVPEVGFTVPTMQIEFYPRLEEKPWMIHRMPIRCFSLYRAGTLERLYGGHTSNNKVLEAFAPVGTDDGATFQTFLQIGWDNFNESDKGKYLRRMRVLGRGKFLLQLRVDFKSTTVGTFLIDYTTAVDLWSLSDLWGVGTWGPAAILKEKRFATDKYFQWLSVVITDAETGIGTRPIDVGAQPYNITSGEWGVLGILYEGSIMGVRT